MCQSSLIVRTIILMCFYHFISCLTKWATLQRFPCSDTAKDIILCAATRIKRTVEIIEFEFGDVSFCGRRKILRTRRQPTTDSTHIWYRVGIEPRPHWREASALTTVPSLLCAKLIHATDLGVTETEMPWPRPSKTFLFFLQVRQNLLSILYSYFEKQI